MSLGISINKCGTEYEGIVTLHGDELPFKCRGSDRGDVFRRLDSFVRSLERAAELEHIEIGD